MKPLPDQARQSCRWRGPLVGLCVVLTLSILPISAQSYETTSTKKKQPTEEIFARAAVKAKQWREAPTTAVKPGEIDQMVDAVLTKIKAKPTPLTNDEEFIRRVYLDVTGHLPVPADVKDFLADKSKNKRAKLIDRLLDSPEYAEHWARYWLDVVTVRVSDRLALAQAPIFEKWMKQQLVKNTRWDVIVRDMLTATGELRRDMPEKNGAAFFLLSRRGADATTERAAEASRLFLGVQIQCAQCHDHPFDVWEQKQFHEFAAYLARVRERPVRDDNKRIVGLRLVSVRFGEHFMPDTNDPKKRTRVYPKFLDGKGPQGRFLTDERRRTSFAASMTSRDNPYFAAAFVNRIWGELLGQSFYMPIDDLGQQREAYAPAVIARLASAFRGSDYDVKSLFRTILNTKTYQRKIALGKSDDQHLYFAASYPRRLQGTALWNSLESVLGRMSPQSVVRGRRNPYARLFGLEGQFLKEFNFDPSSRPEDISSGISQALMLMNSPAIEAKIKAQGTNLLGRILKAYPNNKEAIQMVYLKALARNPSASELARCQNYIRKVGNRAEAFEDLLWVLINSTEFQTRR